MAINNDMAAVDKQIAEAKANVARTETSTVALQDHGVTWWSTTNAMTMCAVVLGFGFLVAAIAAALLWQGKSHVAVLRVFGTILILVLAVFLVVAGYDDKQIAPVLGLLGTVAGYLLGSRESASSACHSSEQRTNEKSG